MPPQRRLKARIDCPSPKSIAPPSQPSPPPPFVVQPPDLRLGFQGSEENPEPEIQKQTGFVTRSSFWQGPVSGGRTEAKIGRWI
ncbi:hypothetical protein HanRHA438_Chr08g0360151 [Helianthus annuus]|nr:hypothetical protein HanPI659440_Chr08g0303671 [Helianthus annuus]KAJ0898731.1 hypothetical protein HanRHA438_Chr08g0360151 [Helianthus annuus]